MEKKESPEPVACPICGSSVTPHWESSYNGRRARCKKCEINWAESYFRINPISSKFV